jgi:hypothetical protein
VAVIFGGFAVAMGALSALGVTAGTADKYDFYFALAFVVPTSFFGVVLMTKACTREMRR